VLILLAGTALRGADAQGQTLLLAARERHLPRDYDRRCGVQSVHIIDFVVEEHPLCGWYARRDVLKKESADRRQKVLSDRPVVSPNGAGQKDKSTLAQGISLAASPSRI